MPKASMLKRRNDAPLDTKKIEEDLKDPESRISKSLMAFVTARSEEIVAMWNILIQNVLAYWRHSEKPIDRASTDDQIVDYATDQANQSNPPIVNAVGAAIVLPPNIAHLVAVIRGFDAKIDSINQQQINNFNTSLQKILASNTLSPNMQRKLANFKMTPEFIAHLDQVYADTERSSKKATAMMLEQLKDDPIKAQGIIQREEGKRIFDQNFNALAAFKNRIDPSDKDDRNLSPSEMKELASKLRDPDTQKPLINEHLDMQKEKHGAQQQKEATTQILKNNVIETANAHIQSTVESLLKNTAQNNSTPRPKNGK